MEVEIERSFLNWSCEDVCHWLSSLLLSQDYTNLFRGDGVTGSSLINLDREALDYMGINDDADRLKILQQITSMRADIVTSGSASPTRQLRSHVKGHVSPTKRIRSPVKGRQFSGESANSSAGHVYRGNRSSRESTGVPPSKQRPSYYVNISVQEERPRTPDSGTSMINSPSQLSTSSDSPESSCINSPVKFHSADMLCEGDKMDMNELNKLQTVATLRYHNMKRISRSMDYLFPDGEDIFSVYHQVSQVEKKTGSPNSNSRLVDILREENVSLKQELETYYQRVRKLQKIEQEVEHIREAHRMIEVSTVRREGLEKALRLKLEQEVHRLREESICLKAELHVSRKQSSGDPPLDKNAPGKREIRRRDTMIIRLIKQNKEAMIAREQLEKDLQSVRSQLLQKGQNGHFSSNEVESRSRMDSGRSNYQEYDTNIAFVYSESIEKLRGVLSAMQNMSQKRERLENSIRSQLEREIRRLNREEGKGEENDEESLVQLKLQNTALQSDVVKWEHKCLEMIAEKNMTFEAAVIPKEARIAALERSLSEKVDMLQELRHQKSVYISQLTEANRLVTELKIKYNSAQSSLKEKDSVIQMMQKSFLEPEEDPVALYSPLPPPLPPHYSTPSSSPYTPRNNSHHCIASGTPSNQERRPIILPPKNTSSYSSSLMVNGTVQPATSSNPISPKLPVRTSPMPSRGNYRSQSASPIKALGSSVKSSSASSRHNGSRETSNRKNGYIHHAPPPIGRLSAHHHQSGNISNSVPNSPNTRNISRKPRISHPNMRFLQVPCTESPGYRQNHGHKGPGDMKRHYKPLPSPSEVKSKTPPPDYRLVTVATGSRSDKQDPPKLPHKLRHSSENDILSPKSGNYSHREQYDNGSLELFQSLVTNNVPVRSRSQGHSNRGALVSSDYNTHRHTKSSPTHSNNKISS